MIPFRRLLATEMRRCLSRRAVHVLVGVALLGIAIASFVGLVTLGPPDPSSPYPHLANLADLWRADSDGTLLPPVGLLALGALIGGAVVVGGEWRAGTVTTLLTWEVRRRRLLTARFVACGLLAPAIGGVLLALYVLIAALPAAVVHGDASLDGEQVAAIAGLAGRGLVVTALAAVFGAALASLGRSTAAGLAAAFVIEAVVQPAVRGLWPERGRWLIGENASAWITGDTITGESFAVGFVAAGVTLLAYVLILGVAATGVFNRRDLAGT